MYIVHKIHNKINSTTLQTSRDCCLNEFRYKKNLNHKVEVVIKIKNIWDHNEVSRKEHHYIIHVVQYHLTMLYASNYTGNNKIYKYMCITQLVITEYTYNYNNWHCLTCNLTKYKIIFGSNIYTFNNAVHIVKLYHWSTWPFCLKLNLSNTIYFLKHSWFLFRMSEPHPMFKILQNLRQPLL